MINQNVSPLRWRQLKKLSMAGVAMMLGIGGKNPSRTWQRYESGESEPPLAIIAKVELISEGQVTTTSWMQVREAFKARSRAGASA